MHRFSTGMYSYGRVSEPKVSIYLPYKYPLGRLNFEQ